MKTRCSAKSRHLITRVLVLALTALLASCGDSGGGIIGTGMTIEGTVPTNRSFASNDVTLKAKSGERSTARISSNGRFSASALTGNGPWLMRVDLGNNNAYYGVAHLVTGSIVQNIHAYSDVAIRNWFGTQGLDIDSAFDGSSAIAQLPTVAEITAINSSFRDQIAAVLEAYDLGSTNLQNVVFNADDTGVDQFLDQNPILISNVNGDVSITININDPATGTQSTAVQGLPINTDLAAIDTIPPNTPSGLRALPSALDEIVLAWNSASDNIGVTSYEISRDGTVIDTTPYPVFIDSPLQAGITYSYTVTALDASGNRSAASQSATSATLAAPDTTAPPAPTGLQLTPGATSIDVRWVQSDIADVANFTVLRGVGDAMLDTLVRVTSSQLIDAGLNSGTTYCYQVIANDASANASNPSANVCAVTGGDVVSPDPTTPPVTDNNDGNAHLLAVDVSSRACSEVLDVDGLTGEATIAEGCYLVNRNMSLDATNLTIEAGVVLKFKDRTGIRISDDSSLNAVGTVQKPIVLTGQQTTAGYWSGLDYVFSNNVKNLLEHVVVEYAGNAGDNTAAVSSNSTSGLTVRLKMANVLMRHSSSYGFLFEGGTVLDRFESITSTQNQQSGKITAQIAGLFGNDLSMTGNTNDGLDLFSNEISSAMTLAYPGVPYNVDRFRVEAPVEVAEGVTIVFDAGGQLRIGQDGSLRISGTATNPVLFTGAQATPGYWQGVEFVFSNSINNDLRHVTIEYGGSGTDIAGNLVTNSAGGLPVRLKLNSVTLKNSSSNGFYFRSGTIMDQFDNVVSTQNEESGFIQPVQVANLGTGNDLSGNVFDRVTIASGSIESAQTWPLVNVPIRFNRLALESALTLTAGQELIGASGAEVYVDREGSLTAVGTAAAPIVIRGEQQTPGYWKGLYYVFSNSTLNVLDHVQISDGGSGAPADNGNIAMNCPTGLPGNLSIANTFITNSAGWGILADDDGCTLTLGENVTYGTNLQGNISN